MTGDILVAIATFTLAIVTVFGLFKTEILNFFYKPKLDIKISMNPPDCVRTPMEILMADQKTKQRAPSYWYRLRIINGGKSRADRVEVFINKLWKLSEDKKYDEVKEFLPCQLKWSNRGFEYFEGKQPIINIYMEVPAYCDLGYIFKKFDELENDKPTPFNIELTVKPLSGYNILQCGKYKLEVIAIASNAKAIARVLEIDNNGRWFHNENEMFAKGCQITAK